jgi:hypothetical protein
MTTPWRPSKRVPGSGQLDERERVLTARIHTMVRIEWDTVVVKALPPAAIPRFLRNEVSAGQWGRQPPFTPHTVTGTVVRLQDTTNLRDADDTRRAFRLDYPGSPFPLNSQTVHLMEFVAGNPDQYLVAFGAPAVLDPAAQLPPNSSEVRETAYAMADAAAAAGVDPNTYRKEIAPWPFSGTGLSSAGDLALPEWWKLPGTVPRGARIVEVGSGGRRTLASYGGATWGWREVR